MFVCYQLHANTTDRIFVKNFIIDVSLEKEVPVVFGSHPASDPDPDSGSVFRTKFALAEVCALGAFLLVHAFCIVLEQSLIQSEMPRGDRHRLEMRKINILKLTSVFIYACSVDVDWQSIARSLLSTWIRHCF